MPKSSFTKDYERFRQILIQARKAAGITQAELSTKLSRPQSFVSKYERGERRLDVIELLEVARALGADPHSILDSIKDGKGLSRPRRVS
jgi:transcriptional regulator with XRE-family HTH domain